MLMSVSMLSAQLAKMFRLRPKINEWCRSNHVHLLYTVRAKTILLLRSFPVRLIGFVDLAALDPQKYRNKGGMQVFGRFNENHFMQQSFESCSQCYWCVLQEALVNCGPVTVSCKLWVRTLRWKENSRVSVCSILSHSCRLVNPQN